MMKKTTLVLIALLAIMPIITHVHADTDSDFWLTHGQWVVFREGETRSIGGLGQGNSLRKARGNFTASETGFYFTLSYSNLSSQTSTHIDIECPNGYFDYAFSIPINSTNSQTEDFSLELNHHINQSALAYNFIIEVWIGLEPWQVTTTPPTTTTEPTNPTPRDPAIIILAVAVSIIGVSVIILALVVRKRT